MLDSLAVAIAIRYWSLKKLLKRWKQKMKYWN